MLGAGYLLGVRRGHGRLLGYGRLGGSIEGILLIYRELNVIGVLRLRYKVYKRGLGVALGVEQAGIVRYCKTHYRGVCHDIFSFKLSLFFWIARGS